MAVGGGNGTRMRVLMRVAVGSGQIVLAMEVDSCFPCELLRRCHRGVPSSRLTGPMINDDRVRSCSSIRRQLHSASPSSADSADRGGGGAGGGRRRSVALPLTARLRNKTLTSAPWLPPLCLTSGHNTEPSSSSGDRSAKATQMAPTHRSSGPVTPPLLYFPA